MTEPDASVVLDEGAAVAVRRLEKLARPKLAGLACLAGFTGLGAFVLAAPPCAQIFTEFVLLHDPIIPFVRVPDHISRLADSAVEEADDFVASQPDFHLAVICI
jgi:hypothetical protein